MARESHNKVSAALAWRSLRLFRLRQGFGGQAARRSSMPPTGIFVWAIATALRSRLGRESPPPEASGSTMGVKGMLVYGTVLQVIETPAELDRSMRVLPSRTVFRCARNSRMPRCPELPTLCAVKQTPGSTFGHTATK